jgi:hypothetical protein
MIKKHKQQALALITVLIFGALAMIVIIFGVTLMVVQTDSARQFLAAQKTLAIAESGMENALIRLLRDPNYSGEILTFPNGTATIIVTNDATSKTVTVTADSGNFLDSIRTIQAVVVEQSGQSIVESWREL